MRSFPRGTKNDSGQEAMDDFEKMKRAEWIEKYKKELRKSGTIFLMDWHRVVLDEAHKIKNADTRSKSRLWSVNDRWLISHTSSIHCLPSSQVQVSVGIDRHSYPELLQGYVSLIVPGPRQPELIDKH